MATLNDNALTTLADVKESLGLDSGDTSKDNLIIRNINFASQVIENYCDRVFKQTEYENEEYDGNDSPFMILRQRPILTAETFTFQYRETSLNDNDWTTEDTENYFIDADAGVVKYLTNYYGRFNRYRFTYSAGYATVPSDVAEACARMSAFLSDNTTGANNVKRKQQGPKEIEYFEARNNEQNSLIDQLGLDEILAPYAAPRVSGYE